MTDEIKARKLDTLSSYYIQTGSSRAAALEAAIMMLASDYIEEMDVMGSKREHAAAELAKEIRKRI